MPLKTLALHAFVALTSPAGPIPDWIPEGYHPVYHKMVVAPSELLESRTLVCWTEGGLGGPQTTVVPGEPFRFSDKYSSRFYLLPEGVEVDEVTRPSMDTRLDLPGAYPPKSEIHDRPDADPLHSALTTIKLVEVKGEALVFEVLSHELFDAQGDPIGATPLDSRTAYWPIFLGAGVALLAALAVARRRRGPQVA